jgi:hypothetical protein
MRAGVACCFITQPLRRGAAAGSVPLLPWEADLAPPSHPAPPCLVCCRQGSIERWYGSTSKWQGVHAVLTRAGFLHCFSPDSAAARAAACSSDGGSSGGGGGTARSSSTGQLAWGGATCWAPPVESLNLSRCSFEQGVSADVSPAVCVRSARCD